MSIYLSIAFVFMGALTSQANTCEGFFVEDNYVIDLAISKQEKTEILEQSRLAQIRSLDPAHFKIGPILRAWKRFNYWFTNHLNSWNTNSYFFHYVRRGDPQKTRFLVKIGLLLEETPEYLKELGLKIEPSDIEGRKTRVSRGGYSVKSEDLKRAEPIFKEMIHNIWRYESLKHDILMLEANARLRQNSVDSLEKLLEMELDFPVSVNVTEKIGKDEKITEGHYTFNSRSEIQDQINTMKGLEGDKFGVNFSNSDYLNGRYLEQAELRGILYIYKAEIQRYPYAFGYPKLRESLLKRLNEIYNDPTLKPPGNFLAKHYLHERHWELHRFLGKRIDTEAGMKATAMLRQNDVIDLGIMDHKLGLPVLIARTLLLTVPVQAFAYVGGFGVPMAADVVNNYFFDSHRAAVVRHVDDKDFSKETIDFFREDFNFDITLPRGEWPDTIKKEFATLEAERAAFKEELRKNNIDFLKMVEYQQKIQKKNERLYFLVPRVVSGQISDYKTVDKKDQALAQKIIKRKQALQRLEYSKEDIEQKLYVEFMILD